MTRRARLLLPETPLHLIQRGNNRSVCFADNDDCLAYLTLLEEVSRACGVAIHAYVLMTNHVHLLACHAHIELNPVRAAMVAHPAEYRWSSYAANAQGAPDSIITPHPAIRDLGTSPAERQTGYRELFRHHLAEGLVDEIRQVTHSGLVLGTPRFQQQVADLLGRRTIRGTPGRKPKPIEDSD